MAALGWLLPLLLLHGLLLLNTFGTCCAASTAGKQAEVGAVYGNGGVATGTIGTPDNLHRRALPQTRPRAVWARHASAAANNSPQADSEFQRRLQQKTKQQLQAGIFGSLSVRTETAAGLEVAGRLRIRPEGSACSGQGSSEMSPFVQPPCGGHICYGPTERSGNVASWKGVRVVRAGIYRLCWCRPAASCAGVDAGYGGPGCCLDDTSFTQDEGELEVVGPDWLSLTARLGRPFNFRLTRGGATIRDTRSPSSLSRTLLRVRKEMYGGNGCGTRRFQTELAFATVARQQEGDDIWYDASVFRKVQFVICWCPEQLDGTVFSGAESGGSPCTDDSDFVAEIGVVRPKGPATEALTPQRAVVGAAFSLTLLGDGLSIGDRLRIISDDVQCGGDGGGTGGHDVAVARYVCGRGDGPCHSSPVISGPPQVAWEPAQRQQGQQQQQQELQQREYWNPVAIFAPGRYRMCWCVDDTWDPVRLDSHGLCIEHRQFGVPVGTLRVEGVNSTGHFHCASFSSCLLRLNSALPFGNADRLLIVAQRSQYTRCGRGTVGMNVPASHVNNSGSYMGEFNVTRTGPPGLFRVCYCHSTSMGVCDDPAAFGQLAGMVTVQASGTKVVQVWSKPQTCEAHTSCSLKITGIWALQVTAQDRFYGSPAGLACGTGFSSDSLSGSIFHLAKRQLLPSSNTWEATFTQGPSERFEAGDFKVCYCASSALSNPQQGCVTATDFGHEVGVLEVMGVRQPTIWSCQQGTRCNLTVLGWRLGYDSQAAVVEADSTCGSRGSLQSSLALGFDHNPSSSPHVEKMVNGMLAHFSLGRSWAAGHWHVCVCVITGSKSGCQTLSDFSQEAGELSIMGSISSVSTPVGLPATATVVSVVVTVTRPGTLRCGVSRQPLLDPPTITEIAYCSDQMIGCLGAATLPWPAALGPTVVHIPLEANRTELLSVLVPVVHVWCVGDAKFCPSYRCAMPPTRNGLAVRIYGGVDVWRTWHAVTTLPFSMEVSGDHLNLQGGRLKVTSVKATCSVGKEAFHLGRPFTSTAPTSATWSITSAPAAGHYAACWCERSYGPQCVHWEHVGNLTVAGPVSAALLFATVTVGDVFIVRVTGVELSDSDYLELRLGQGCGSSGSPATQNASFPIWFTPELAQWNLSAPMITGSAAVCWGRHGLLLAKVAQVVVTEEARDCQLGNWSSMVEPPTCSRTCGGGTFQVQRQVLVQTTGTGQPCPPESALIDSRPCNTHACPSAVVMHTSTQPSVVRQGSVFRVLVEGFNLDPAEDRVLLLAGHAVCGSVGQHAGGASCMQPSSNSTQLLCGDGKHSLRVDDAGFYTVCVCVASSVLGPPPGTCTGTAAYDVTPSSGSVLQILRADSSAPQAPSSPDAHPAPLPAKTGAPASSQLQTRKQHMELDAPPVAAGTTLSLLDAASIGAASLALVVLCAWCAWRRGLARWCFRNTQERRAVEKPPSLVAQATMDAWNAYNRAIFEMPGEEGYVYEGEDQTGADGSAATSAAAVAALADAAEADGSKPLSTPPQSSCSTRQATTPPLTGRGTRETTPPRTPPRSGGSIKTVASRHSLLKLELQPYGNAPVPTVPGSSFLNLPLAGQDGPLKPQPPPSGPGPIGPPQCRPPDPLGARPFDHRATAAQDITAPHAPSCGSQTLWHKRTGADPLWLHTVTPPASRPFTPRGEDTAELSASSQSSGGSRSSSSPPSNEQEAPNATAASTDSKGQQHVGLQSCQSQAHQRSPRLIPLELPATPMAEDQSNAGNSQRSSAGVTQDCIVAARVPANISRKPQLRYQGNLAPPRGPKTPLSSCTARPPGIPVSEPEVGSALCLASLECSERLSKPPPPTVKGPPSLPPALPPPLVRPGQPLLNMGESGISDLPESAPSPVLESLSFAVQSLPPPPIPGRVETTPPRFSEAANKATSNESTQQTLPPPSPPRPRGLAAAWKQRQANFRRPPPPEAPLAPRPPMALQQECTNSAIGLQPPLLAGGAIDEEPGSPAAPQAIAAETAKGMLAAIFPGSAMESDTAKIPHDSTPRLALGEEQPGSPDAPQTTVVETAKGMLAANLPGSATESNAANIPHDSAPRSPVGKQQHGAIPNHQNSVMEVEQEAIVATDLPAECPDAACTELRLEQEEDQSEGQASNEASFSLSLSSRRSLHQRNGMLDEQERIRAAWYERLAADPHNLPGAAIEAPEMRKRPGNSLRAAARNSLAHNKTPAPSEQPAPLDTETGRSYRRPKGKGALGEPGAVHLPGPPLGPGATGSASQVRRPTAPTWAFTAS